MIRLRGHHLICLHFFQGEGYNKEFVDNLRKLLQRAGHDEEIEVVEGADDVCLACPHLSENQCVHKGDADQEIRRLDSNALELLVVRPGEKVKWGEICLKVKSAPGAWFLAFCLGCDWEGLCQREQKQRMSP